MSWWLIAIILVVILFGIIIFIRKKNGEGDSYGNVSILKRLADVCKKVISRC